MGVCGSTTEEVDGRTKLPPVNVPEERAAEVQQKIIISPERVHVTRLALSLRCCNLQEEGLEMAVASMEARFFKEVAYISCCVLGLTLALSPGERS